MAVASPWETALFCYAILAVDADADDETINAAYLRLAALRHPRGHGASDAASTEFYRTLESNSARIRQTLDDLAADASQASRDFFARVRQREDDTKETCRAEFAAALSASEAGNPRLNDYVSLLASSRSRGDGRPAPARARRRAKRRGRGQRRRWGSECRGHGHDDEEIKRVEVGNEAVRRAVHDQCLLIHDARRELAVVSAELARVRRERNARLSVRGKADGEIKKTDGGGIRKGGSDVQGSDDAVGGDPRCVSWWEEQRRAWLMGEVPLHEQLLRNAGVGDTVRVI
ncbi:hypothetical protein NEMBOFW57_000053 [Staphylotrichum longicolle]|uniref:J domain-containing protein n=1 Tax=Staphylotrichum longicolle TaxID=669026 RepID=A0AAD4EZ18_9PEZI|nr:hypothetical protein NEMBOFW57_000053 [Staphylotrichum longicolle]